MHSEFPLGTPDTAMAAGNVVELNEGNIKQLIDQSAESPVLIHFWAQMVNESVAIIPELKNLAQQANGAFTLALLNCEQEQMIASQFGIQALPTIAVFVNGQPVDGLGGPQPIEAIKEMLSKHLPSEDELTLKSALIKQQAGEHAAALLALDSLTDALKERGDVKLVRADCLLATQQFEQAEQLLETIPLEYKDSDYKRLIAALELHQQAANSPEILGL
jgi:putative thioredoxin